jgi:uncharacterized protein YjbJ (UPF0337 family)
MNKDQVKGGVKQAKGQVKEAVGKITGNGAMEGKGEVQIAVGKAQKSYGDLKEEIKKEGK